MPTPVLGPTPTFAPVPLWMRFVLWVVAVPLSFFIMFLVARATGLFTSSQLSDVFLANDAARFWPVIRMLPFVALLTAGLVHGGVYVIARQRGRRHGARLPAGRTVRVERGCSSSLSRPPRISASNALSQT